MPHRPIQCLREWHSADGRFRVVIGEDQLERLVHLSRKAGRVETGGILVGSYSEVQDTAVIARVTGPPRDSRAGRSFFDRGTRGLQALLDRLWRSEHEYYLGEWHFHPGGEAEPSDEDRRQMRSFATCADVRCPEPILLIVGGYPETGRSVRAFVYPNGDQRELELAPPSAGHDETPPGEASPGV